MVEAEDMLTRQMEELEDAANVFMLKVKAAITQCAPTKESKTKAICKMLDAQLLLNHRFNKTLNLLK